MVPVRGYAPKKLIYQFRELAERLNALECGHPATAGPPLIADGRTLNSVHRFGLNGKLGPQDEERNKMKNGRLNGKVAVVTGASKGIGAGIAKELGKEGASVIVNYASAKHDADRVVDEISKRGGKAVAIQGNVASKADV